MLNDTMNRKWKHAMKAHEVLKALQHTQNTVKSITFTHFIVHTILKLFELHITYALNVSLWMNMVGNTTQTLQLIIFNRFVQYVYIN